MYCIPLCRQSRGFKGSTVDGPLHPPTRLMMCKRASLQWIWARHPSIKVNSKGVDNEMGVPYSSCTPAQMGWVAVGHAVAFACADRYTAGQRATPGYQERRLNAREFFK